MKLKLLIFFFFSFFSLNAQSDGWKFLKTTDGINIYVKDDGNGLKELKLQTHFTKKLSVVVAALQDVPSYPKWVYRATSSEKIKQINDWECIYRNFLDFPWPIADRDVVVYNKMEQNKTSKLVISNSFAKNDVMAEKKDIIRITDMRSKWVLKPEEKGVYAEYYFRSHPGGGIPDWTINAAIEEGPVKTIQGLKKMLNSGVYDAHPNSKIID